MRAILILVLLCVGCDEAARDESAESETVVETTSNAETTPDVAPEPATPTPPAAETTAGFIEAKVDGELKRFEYLPAGENTAAANGTFLEARATADRNERFELSLVHLDVREMDFPTTIRSNVRAMKMAGMNYWDAEGTGHPVVFNDDSFECQSLEDLLLRCTFSGTAHPNRGGPVEITDGRLEVQLTTNEVRDRFIEATSGAAGRAPGN